MNDKEDTYALVVCRGKSTQYAVDNSTVHEKSSSIFKANQWKYGAPGFLIANSKISRNWQNSTVSCIMHHPEFLIRRPVTGEKVMMLECLSSYYKKRHGKKILSKEKIREPALIDWEDTLVKAWELSDKGLNCILIASMQYKNIKIVGFDLWEADYWTDGRFDSTGWYSPPEPRKTTGIPNHKERLLRGGEIKCKVLDLLFDFMRLKKDSSFEFYTLSKSLHERQKEEKLPNVTVELIEKIQ